jgi:hypothetical protein
LAKLASLGAPFLVPLELIEECSMDALCVLLSNRPLPDLIQGSLDFTAVRLVEEVLGILNVLERFREQQLKFFVCCLEQAISGAGSKDALAFTTTTLTGIVAIRGGGGNDTITGSSGQDLIIGGVGIDVLAGGGGKYTFLFNVGDTAAAAGNRDKVKDFTVGVDQLGTSNLGSWPSSAPALSMTAGAKEIRFVYAAAHNATIVQGDTNGDKAVDFAIEFSGNIALTAGDFTVASLAQTASTLLPMLSTAHSVPVAIDTP